MFKRKYRGLRGPKITKWMLRFAIRKKSRIAYAAVLAWPKAVALAVAVFIVIKIQPSNVPPWLYHSKTIICAVLAAMYVVDSSLPALRSWRRRYASSSSGAVRSAQDGS
jgi:hypothetical protein